MKTRFDILNVITPFVLVVVVLVLTLSTKKEAVSDLEKRKLAELPQFNLKNWLNGSFASSVDDYLADHVIYRNSFIALADDCKKVYNYRLNSSHTSPTEGVMVKVIAQQLPKYKKGNAQVIDQSNSSKVMLDTNQELVRTEGIYIYDSCAYQFFGGSKNSAGRYAKSVNALRANLGDSIKFYSLLVPSATEFFLPKVKYQGKSSSEEANMIFLFGKLSPNILSTNIYKRLASHNREYLFFKTDHHWTARGAYYAYLDFSEVAGFSPTPLDQMKPTYMKSNFLGSLYALTRDFSLKGNPDRIEYFDINFHGATAYYKMNPTDHWSKTQIINKKKEFGLGYGVFLGIDYPVMKIDGPVKNGRILLIIKDSYANAFIPFLVAHFERIYVADIRYFPYKITPFIHENHINEVLVMNHIVTANSPFASNKLIKLIK